MHCDLRTKVIKNVFHHHYSVLNCNGINVCCSDVQKHMFTIKHVINSVKISLTGLTPKISDALWAMPENVF